MKRQEVEVIAREVGFPVFEVPRLLRTRPKGVPLTADILRKIMTDIMSDPEWAAHLARVRATR